MKWMGAILLIISTTCIGLYVSHRLEKRPKHIRQFKNALQILEAEITYSQVALPLAFQTLATQLPKPLNNFFHRLSEDMLMKKQILLICGIERLNSLPGMQAIN